MNIPVIVAAKRTPIGKYGGIFKNIPPEQLAAEVMRSILQGCPVHPSEIDDVILGNTVGPGGNLARLSALTAGLPVDVPGVTVDRQCGSGLEAINMAARLIQAGAGSVYLAGGVESTSRAPWKIERPLSLYDLHAPQFYTRARFSTDSIGDPEMGIAAENVAGKYNISRDAQDRYALESHQKATQSIQTGRFIKEIVPISLIEKQNLEKQNLEKQNLEKQNAVFVDTDECPRQNTNLQKLSALPTVFKENGTVTAGNACPINDGAAVVLIMSMEKAKSLGLCPVLTFIDAICVGVDPNYLGIGPVPAVRKLLQRNHLRIQEIDLIEFNEAFASQVLASLHELEIPVGKVNVGGGALALGHPYGASGAILVTRLCAEVSRIDAGFVLATLGIGGGLGLATLFKNALK